MRIYEDIKLDFKDVLFRPKRGEVKSRNEVNLERTYTFCHSKKTWTGVPLMAANMDTTGTFETAVVMAANKCITVITKHYTIEDWREFLTTVDPAILKYISVCCGITDADIQKVSDIFDISPAIDFLCCDVANGYNQTFIDCVRNLRKRFPDKTIIAGNVVTNELTEELIFSGADIVKVGIGSGSVCTTRRLTGVGYPQLSASSECGDAAHGHKGHIICDGGCTSPGDVAKAFGSGADFVMLGGMLAGHDESGGELVQRNGLKYKVFYGMSSDTAMKKYVGTIANYRSSEGRTVELRYRGPLEGTILDILGGIRSTCTYVGAQNLKELPRRTTFVRVTQQLNEVYANSTLEQENRHAPSREEMMSEC